MKVHFIGAGPGAEDLITMRGFRLIQSCQVCLYAGSLVREAIIAHVPEGAAVYDTAKMDLDEITEVIGKAHEEDKDVARVHSGDPCIYGAIAEQSRRLRALGIEYDVTPGVPSFAASAAAIQSELTVPGISQTIIITRTTMDSSPMPEHESLEVLGQARATMAIHLSIRNIEEIQKKLVPLYGADCPVVIVHRASWPDQMILKGQLGTIHHAIKEKGITRTAQILIGPALGAEEFEDSALYDPHFSHCCREGKTK